ncbi:DUF2239 family protein [Acuticoccus sp. MNP-M23]|uniref:DUF2239 family protein n=1 Tax=Acuticoccus sp. MNP-M23 TaxID=3072793 RepID=UPI0028167E18|nr:DUF2239 family protein [Acuticoccus sp. MNP-M23]WMS43544.1 DUF2239 family protein [Acuticoccus sp. MNP-M23]
MSSLAEEWNRAAAAFAGGRMVAEGALLEVALCVKAAGDAGETGLLVLDDATGAVIDVDVRGDREEIAARLAGASGKSAGADAPAASGRRGRPKLGVVAREVTLLPRHWDWLGAQKGGASATLRRLIDEKRRGTAGADTARAAQDTTYHAMTVLAGDRPNYEEATRALFAADIARFNTLMADWPADVRTYLARLAAPLGAAAETAAAQST